MYTTIGTYYSFFQSNQFLTPTGTTSKGGGNVVTENLSAGWCVRHNARVQGRESVSRNRSHDELQGAFRSNV